MKKFTNFKEWEAAVQAAGFTIDRTPSHEGPHPHDLHEPIIAVNSDNAQVGGFWTFKEGEDDIGEAYAAAEITKEEADAQWEALPWSSEGVLFDNPNDFLAWQYAEEKQD